MQLKLDDEVLIEIDEHMLKLLAHSLKDPIADLKERLCSVIQDECYCCYEHIKAEWFQKLIEDPSVLSIPSDKNKFVELVFEHPKYKNRKQREQLRHG